MRPMLLSHQCFPSIPLVLTAPYLLKAQMAADPTAGLAAVLAVWQNSHKKSHQMQPPSFSSHSQKVEKISLPFRPGTRYLHLYSILSAFLCQALGLKNE